MRPSKDADIPLSTRNCVVSVLNVENEKNAGNARPAAHRGEKCAEWESSGNKGMAGNIENV
jgi:hypothetical protein